MVELPEQVFPAIQDVVRELVKGNFETLEQDGRSGKLTAKELERAIQDYGATLVNLEDEALKAVDVYRKQGVDNCWAVDLDLWTVEQGRSDLTLSLTIEVRGQRVNVAIDDLHVL